MLAGPKPTENQAEFDDLSLARTLGLYQPLGLTSRYLRTRSKRSAVWKVCIVALVTSKKVTKAAQLTSGSKHRSRTKHVAITGQFSWSLMAHDCIEFAFYLMDQRVLHHDVKREIENMAFSGC